MVSGISNQSLNQNINCRPIKDKVGFAGKKQDSDKINYENPINRGMEKTLAVGGAGLFSAVAGVATFFASKSMLNAKQAAGMMPKAIGAGVGALVALCTIPSALYNTNVSSFTRKKEMDVFSREKSVETSLSEGIDKNIKNEEKSLEENISDYTRYKVGKNGNGMAFLN